MQKQPCPLCSGNLEQFTIFRNILYHRCLNCHAVLMDPRFYLSAEAEKERYDQHNNDPADPGYRRFVSPLVEKIKAAYGPEACGLDYGAGSGPVAAALLIEAGYTVKLYDPYYWHDPLLLETSYDFIMAIEVIEHFYQPFNEFKQLRNLLNPGGKLFCMTKIVTGHLDFENWHYKNDPTHVFFYHRDSLSWIKENLGFQSLQISGRIIELAL
jgi:SAM-dependent methyltransferase